MSDLLLREVALLIFSGLGETHESFKDLTGNLFQLSCRSFKDRDIVGAAPSIAKEQEKAAERSVQQSVSSNFSTYQVLSNIDFSIP